MGDFNNDGNLDLAVTNSASNTVSVLLGNGDGTFQAATSTNVPQNEGWQKIAVADFNGDHKLDVASGSSDALLLGNGDGTFQNPVQLANDNATTLAVGDFNDDGKLGQS